MKNLINRSLALLTLGIIGIAGLSQTTRAQDVAGRIAFGIDAGGNKYYGNYTDNQFAFHGDAFIRWNIFDWLSLHAAYNGGQLKYKASTASIANEAALFPNSTASTGTLGTVNHTRVGGWDIMASYNVFPDQTFVPYVIAGVEALNFEPNDANDANLRGNASAAYSKNVIGGVMGVGFEMFISPKVTFNGKGLLHLTGTDWIDDYSNPNDYRQDAFVTMGLGFSYYIFAPDVEAAPAQAEVSERTIIHDITEKTVYHTDTIFVKDPTDTVYISNPKINTVFNFPGTLFIVNTDQFNTAEPNNMANLYQIKRLVEQCPNLKVEIQGFASEEGTTQHNQELSERRAARIKSWLIEQGVNSNKVTRTVGFGETNNAVRERSDVSAKTLEAERTQNRRIAVKVVQACSDESSR
ncbi:MAG: OmpA family protein [Bacteroidota bacterium]|nr:OmpA family protein [Bacteroidota bacterium]MDP4234165.1 OmpA family protein [Bacteroidota bacterium]MDP4244013.1 OmpA family protein [Bacteroidota bacterium]MDP4287865.1 OmpA family protein [Bacteroidota bacterium]